MCLLQVVFACSKHHSFLNVFLKKSHALITIENMITCDFIYALILQSKTFQKPFNEKGQPKPSFIKHFKTLLKFYNKTNGGRYRCFAVDDAYGNGIAAVGFDRLTIRCSKSGIAFVAFKRIAVRF